MITRFRQLRHRDDGVSLVLVLLIVTVVAVVTAAIVSQADTSVRTTVAFRTQSGSDYAADGAGQVAVNMIRQSTFSNATGQTCFSAGNTIAVPYPATNGLEGSNTGSSFVSCTAEDGTGSQGSPVPITDANRPGQAIYAHGNLSFGDTGAETDYIRGSVSAGGNISVSGTLSITGTGSTLTATGTCPAAGSLTGPVTTCTHPAAGADAPISAPAIPGAAPNPTCPTAKGGPEIFSPGTYNLPPPSYGVLCPSKPSVGWYYFKPGVYNFANMGTWTVDGTPTVAGTLDLGGDGTGANASCAPSCATTAPSGGLAAPTVPGACVNPILSTSAIGVELVFSGNSALKMQGSLAEFCSDYHKLSIPTVLYTTASGTLITTKSGSKPEFYFEGFIYAPNADMNLSVNNVAQPFMNFGVVANNLHFGANPSTKCVACAFINLPDNSPGFGTGSTIVDLKVYVCPGSSSCSASGKLQLTARVQVFDPSGTPTIGARQMKILSWSQQR